MSEKRAPNNIRTNSLCIMTLHSQEGSTHLLQRSHPAADRLFTECHETMTRVSGMLMFTRHIYAVIQVARITS